MLVKFEVHKYVGDWFEYVPKEIDTDDYSYFTIECRGKGEIDWYLVGHKWDANLGNTKQTDFAVIHLYRMVAIYHQIKDKVKEIRVYHMSQGNNSIEVFMESYIKYKNTLEKNKN